MAGSPTAEGRQAIRILAPAKLNLGLRVVGVRNDGYHCLESVFVPLDWADELWVEAVPNRTPEVDFEMKRAEDAVQTRAIEIPDGEMNLAHRAVRGFIEASDCSLAVRIRLTKRLPAAAGLGGGSSDAGAVLRALNQLLPGCLAPERCRHLACELGADVAFFLDPRPALVTGIGEQIDPLEDWPILHLLLANPGDALSTPEVFAAWDELSVSLTQSRSGSTLGPLSALRGASASAIWDPLAELVVNDLEPAAKRLCPGLSGVMDQLSQLGARVVGMSGSGATVFGVYESLEEANKAQSQIALGGTGWSRLARTLSAG